MRKLLLHLFIFAITFLSGCKNEEPAETPIPNTYLNLAPSGDISFPETGKSVEITVSTNVDSWNVISDQDWCKVTKSIDGKKFIVLADNNTSINPEPANITISAEGVTPTTIKAIILAPISDRIFVAKLKNTVGFITRIEAGKEIIDLYNDTNQKKFRTIEGLSLWTPFNYPDSNKIISLSGIENFTSLKTLSFSGNNVTSLDISRNTNLTSLDCGDNKLTTLDISRNTSLTSLECRDNKLTTLDISKNTNLTRLECQNNLLTTLDISKNTNLTSLYCQNNLLTTLDLSGLNLESLTCGENRLTVLDVSENTKLTYLSCENNQLTALDISKNIFINRLECNGNKLITLDVSQNILIRNLTCDNNELTTLDLSKNLELFSLRCSGNKLTALDISKNIYLRDILCYDNRLTTLDISMIELLNYSFLRCGTQKENITLNLFLTSEQLIKWDSDHKREKENARVTTVEKP